jgi:hypothetical protein
VNGDAVDIKRYGDVFWEFFIAGGQVTAGGDIGEKEDPLNPVSVFGAETEAEMDALVASALGVLQRKTFMRPILEDSFNKLSLFLNSFSEVQVIFNLSFLFFFSSYSLNIIVLT